MGRLSLKNTTSYSFYLTITGEGSAFSDTYIVQNTLYNGKKYYKAQNSPFVIFWSTFGTEWRLAIALGAIGFYDGVGNTQYPWEANWGQSFTFSLLNINNNKISIKKQNLTSLLPYALDNFRNLYIFKGGGANTIGTVFNKDDFIKNILSSNADRLSIFTPDLATSSNYWVRSDTNLWTRTSNGAVSTDVVILENYVIVIFAEGDPSLNLPKSINNGAIVQRYNSGKISLFQSNIVLAPSLEITPLGIGYNVNSVNSTSSGMPQNISYFGNPLDQTGYISNTLTNTNHYWKFTIANGYKIYFALDTGDGYSPSNIDSSIAIRSGSTWVESNVLSQQNFGQNQQGQYLLSSAQPYSAGTYSLRITNLTATTVSYRIRFIITAA